MTNFWIVRFFAINEYPVEQTQNENNQKYELDGTHHGIYIVVVNIRSEKVMRVVWNDVSYNQQEDIFLLKFPLIFLETKVFVHCKSSSYEWKKYEKLLYWGIE